MAFLDIDSIFKDGVETQLEVDSILENKRVAFAIQYLKENGNSNLNMVFDELCYEFALSYQPINRNMVDRILSKALCYF